MTCTSPRPEPRERSAQAPLVVLPRPAPCDPRDVLGVLLCGGRGDAPTAAERLLERPLAESARLSARELASRFGLSRAAAQRLAAAFALARTVQGEWPVPTDALADPAAAARVLRPHLAGLEQETFLALLLDAKHRLKRCVRVSEGSLTSSIVHPREVFRAAVRESAAALIVGHNHPSGDPEPSPEDLAVTRRLFDAGKLLGIPFLDHLVLGDPASEGGYVSIRARFGLPPRAARPRGP